MKNYDYKAKMNQNRKRFVKRVAGLTVATTLVVGAPVATNVLSNEALQNTFGTTVAHAAVDNIMETDNFGSVSGYYNEEYNYTRYILQNDAAGTDINVDDYNELTYIVQLPDELSYILEDKFFLDSLVAGQNNGEFMMTGSVVDENGNETTINRSEHNPAGFVSVNQATNSIEFDLHNFLNENGFVSVQYFGFTVPIYQQGKYPIPNGDYTFKTALVAADSADLNNVGNADNLTLTVENSEADPGDGEEPEEPGDGEDTEDDDAEQPEEPGDGEDAEDGDAEQPEEPGDGEDADDDDAEQPEEPGDGEDADDDDTEQPEEPGDGEDAEEDDAEQPEEPSDGEDDDAEQPEEPGDGDNAKDDGTEQPEQPGDDDDAKDDGAGQTDDNKSGVGGNTDNNNTNGTNGDVSNDPSKQEGQKLPKTATDTWNYGLAGALALLLGIATKVVSRFKRTV